MPGKRATHRKSEASGRSPAATTTMPTPAAPSRATPSWTALLSPLAGSQTTVAPRWRAQAATSVSSQTTATGSPPAERTTLVAITRARAARAGGESAGARRSLA